MQAITFVIAFIVVLALIAGTAWLVRRFAGNRLGTTANRGRMPRLAVIDAAGGSGIGIEEEFDPSLPPVLGSPDGLVQVLINLIANAREACRDVARPRIVVRTRFASGLQLHAGKAGRPVRLPIELRVSDNGPGVDPAMRDHIFEPFVTTKKTGQGLGLALVRKLVRDMNGRIGHERDDAAGWTHFRVHLPLAVELRRRPEERGEGR